MRAPIQHELGGRSGCCVAADVADEGKALQAMPVFHCRPGTGAGILTAGSGPPAMLAAARVLFRCGSTGATVRPPGLNGC